MIFKGVEICCPRCREDLREADSLERAFQCPGCGSRYPVVAGIPDLRIFSDPYIEARQDRAKGLRLAAHGGDMTFAQLAAYYYSITPDVPAHRARKYFCGLISGVARAEASLASWEAHVGDTGPRSEGRLLEIGCGTGPLLVAAASRYPKLVGIDIAFRWLVVAKKRLEEAGLDIPLLGACAEALPFPAGSFHRIVMDSTLEHTRDQQQVLGECHRTMLEGGRLFVSTPNKFSVGPDPHAGIWAGGYLPESWVAAYARWRGARPPQRHLLSARSLDRLIADAGFSRPQILLAAVSEEQRQYFGEGVKLLIDFYHLAQRIPLSRQMLRLVGPLLWALSEKPAVAPEPWRN